MELDLVEEHVYKHIDYNSEAPYRYNVRYYNATTYEIKTFEERGTYKQVLDRSIRLIHHYLKGFKIVLIDRIGL